MQVFAFFDVNNPHPLVRLWVKSWRKHGFKPRLLLEGEREARLISRKGGGRYAEIGVINFSCGARNKHPKKTEWPDTSGDLVRFPAGATEETVLKHWRPRAD